MIIDLFIIIILILFLYFGYSRGLIKVGFKFLSLIFAIILAILLHEPVSNMVINNTTIDEKIEDAIIQNINFTEQDTDSQDKVIIKEKYLPSVLINNIGNSIKMTAETTKEKVEMEIAKQLTNSIINILVLLIIFVLIKIILDILDKVLGLISKLPVIHQFDKLGGIIIGLLEGIFIIYLLLALCLIFAPFLQSTDLLKLINESTIGSILYNDNILLKFIN